jgi:hypothetical protein
MFPVVFNYQDTWPEASTVMDRRLARHDLSSYLLLVIRISTILIVWKLQILFVASILFLTYYTTYHMSFRLILRRFKPTKSTVNSIRSYAMENDKGQGVSHAKDSQVPESIQKKAPSKLEHELPDVSKPAHLDLKSHKQHEWFASQKQLLMCR